MFNPVHNVAFIAAGKDSVKLNTARMVAQVGFQRGCWHGPWDADLDEGLRHLRLRARQGTARSWRVVEPQAATRAHGFAVDERRALALAARSSAPRWARSWQSACCRNSSRSELRAAAPAGRPRGDRGTAGRLRELANRGQRRWWKGDATVQAAKGLRSPTNTGGPGTVWRVPCAVAAAPQTKPLTSLAPAPNPPPLPPCCSHFHKLPGGLAAGVSLPVGMACEAVLGCVLNLVVLYSMGGLPGGCVGQGAVQGA
jgi:hypothetical protein